MRKRFIVGLVVVNVVLAVAILFGPASAQVFGSALRTDCCQGATCCENCCWFTQNCSPGGTGCLKI